MQELFLFHIVNNLTKPSERSRSAIIQLIKDKWGEKYVPWANHVLGQDGEHWSAENKDKALNLIAEGNCDDGKFNVKPF